MAIPMQRFRRASRSSAKNIFCVESLWNDDIVNKLSVLPLLELSAKLSSIEYIHLTCNTIAEFRFNLRFLSRRRAYQILYLAFHGSPGHIGLSSEEEMSLLELGDLLSCRFPNLIVHIGSCESLIEDRDLERTFLKTSGVAMLSGYSKSIDWCESAAIDLLLFAELQDYKNLSSMRKSFAKKYPDLIERSGFRIIIR